MPWYLQDLSDTEPATHKLDESLDYDRSISLRNYNSDSYIWKFRFYSGVYVNKWFPEAYMETPFLFFIYNNPMNNILVIAFQKQ